MPRLEEEKAIAPPEEHALIEAPAEERLRQEVQELRRQVEELRSKDKDKGKHEEHKPIRPKSRTLWILGLIVLVVLVAGFFLGWLPRHRREQRIEEAAREEAHAEPKLQYVVAKKSAPSDELLLPGTTQAIQDSPILARSDGYVAKRIADIGDHVKKGQLLAVIAAPDLDQQVVQARAQVSQSEAAVRQAVSNLQQGHANEALARVTAARYEALVKRGAVAIQDNDQQQTAYQAQLANLESLQHALDVANENLKASRANLQRLIELQGFERVTAPFDGVVTLRNTDEGALITNGATLLYRVSRIDRLLTYISVPQPNSPSVTVGSEAQLLSPEFGAKRVVGRVTRTAEALDPATRTLLTEIQVDNRKGDLRPGMFVNVRLKSPRDNPPILIPGDAIVAGADGVKVAVFRDAHEVPPDQQQEAKADDNSDQKKGKKTNDNQKQDEGKGAGQNKKDQHEIEGTVRFARIQVGRDYGAATEVYSGLQDGDMVIVNPNDAVHDGVRARGTATQPKLDVEANKSPGGGSRDANSEKLQPVPGAETPVKQPSKMNKNRGPGY